MTNALTDKKYKEINFFYSPLFTVCIAVFVLVFWTFGLSVYGILALAVLGGVIFALCRDLTPMVPLCFMFVQIISDGETAFNGTYFYFGAGAALIIGLIVHLLRFRPFSDYGKIKGFTAAVCVSSLAVMLGGITLSGRNGYAVLLICVCALSAAGISFLMVPTLGRDDRKRFAKTVFLAVCVSSALAVVQLAVVLLRSNDVIGAISSKYLISAGYAHPNYLANIIARSIPLAVYLSTRSKKGSALWLWVAYFEGAAILLTSSRATLLVAFIAALAAVIFFYRKVENKIVWVCNILMIIGITMVGVAFLSDKFEAMFATLVRHGFDSSGRFDLWKIAVERFKSSPVFGVGLDYDLGGRVANNPTNEFYTPYWYHNTFMQIICCFGIFGVLAYAFYFYRQYRAMILARSPIVTALFFVLIFIQAVSLLDVFFFTPQEYLEMLIITAVGLKYIPSDKENTFVYNIIGFAKKLKRSNK